LRPKPSSPAPCAPFVHTKLADVGASVAPTLERPPGTKLLRMCAQGAHNLSIAWGEAGVPGSQIKAASVRETVVLAGSAINPIDANRAGELSRAPPKRRDAMVNMLAAPRELVFTAPRQVR
jgi:hypothetical protein